MLATNRSHCLRASDNNSGHRNGALRLGGYLGGGLWLIDQSNCRPWLLNRLRSSIGLLLCHLWDDGLWLNGFGSRGDGHLVGGLWLLGLSRNWLRCHLGDGGVDRNQSRSRLWGGVSSRGTTDKDWNLSLVSLASRDWDLHLDRCRDHLRPRSTSSPHVRGNLSFLHLRNDGDNDNGASGRKNKRHPGIKKRVSTQRESCLKLGYVLRESNIESCRYRC